MAETVKATKEAWEFFHERIPRRGAGSWSVYLSRMKNYDNGKSDVDLVGDKIKILIEKGVFYNACKRSDRRAIAHKYGNTGVVCVSTRTNDEMDLFQTGIRLLILIKAMGKYIPPNVYYESFKDSKSERLGVVEHVHEYKINVSWPVLYLFKAIDDPYREWAPCTNKYQYKAQFRFFNREIKFRDYDIGNAIDIFKYGTLFRSID